MNTIEDNNLIQPTELCPELIHIDIQRVYRQVAMHCERPAHARQLRLGFVEWVALDRAIPEKLGRAIDLNRVLKESLLWLIHPNAKLLYNQSEVDDLLTWVALHQAKIVHRGLIFRPLGRGLITSPGPSQALWWPALSEEPYHVYSQTNELHS